MDDIRGFIMHDLKLLYLSSVVIAILMAVVSMAGILNWNTIYPAPQTIGSVGSDVFNLVAILPILLISMWLAHRGSLIGLLLWPGALFYVLYIYVFNIIGLPVTVLFLPYVLLVVMSVYTILGIFASIDGDAARQRLSGIVPRRAAGGVLMAFAILFIAIDAYAVIATLLNHTPVDIKMQGTWIADFVVECPALLVGGVLLWRRGSAGYAASVGLLLQIGALLVAVPVGAVLGAVQTGSSIDTSSAMLLIMGVIPIALLVFIIKGAVSDRGQSPARRNNGVENHE